MSRKAFWLKKTFNYKTKHNIQKASQELQRWNGLLDAVERRQRRVPRGGAGVVCCGVASRRGMAPPLSEWRRWRSASVELVLSQPVSEVVGGICNKQPLLVVANHYLSNICLVPPKVNITVNVLPQKFFLWPPGAIVWQSPLTPRGSGVFGIFNT